MKIADVESAYTAVRAYIDLLEAARGEWSRHYDVPDVPWWVGRDDSSWQELRVRVLEELPRIQRIARLADAAVLADHLVPDYQSVYPFGLIEDASRQLGGLLRSWEGDTEQFAAPRGPNLTTAASLHPWVWEAAARLWDDGHRREAIQAAALALFDHHLPGKLGVPPAQSAKDLLAQAFSTDAPAAGKPRLRLSDYPDPSPSWTSQHEGARFFGMGCAQLIRNLSTHNSAQPDEQTALEQLAALSGLARLIDRAMVIL